MLLVVENDLMIRAEGDLTTTRVGRKRRRDQTNAVTFSPKQRFSGPDKPQAVGLRARMTCV
jgi:hypothetical protein